jgi:phosphoribosylformylglycinamidine synthase subunit PurL
VLLGDTFDELGGSEYIYVTRGLVRGMPPRLDLSREKSLQQAVLASVREGLVTAAHDLSEGGLAVAVAECCIGGEIGAEVELASCRVAH